MTVFKTIGYGTRYLAQSGVEYPRLNAEYLLAYILQSGRLDLYLEFGRCLNDSEYELFWKLIRCRSEHYPLQYLLGTVEFYGRQFICDYRALIPRQETELLVELALPCLLNLDKDKPMVLLDVGTGSGIIAATLATALPQAFVDATDISTDALSLAAENLKRHQLVKRVQLHQADLFPKKDEASYYEAIFANLPYIPTEEIATLPLEVRYEPIEALDGGLGGIIAIERLIESAMDHLRPGGWLWLEIGSQQEEKVTSILRKNGFAEINIHRDYNHFPRFLSTKK